MESRKVLCQNIPFRKPWLKALLVLSPWFWRCLTPLRFIPSCPSIFTSCRVLVGSMTVGTTFEIELIFSRKLILFNRSSCRVRCDQDFKVPRKLWCLWIAGSRFLLPSISLSMGPATDDSGEPPICLKPRVLRFRDRLFSTGPVTSTLPSEHFVGICKDSPRC